MVRRSCSIAYAEAVKPGRDVAAYEQRTNKFANIKK